MIAYIATPELMSLCYKQSEHSNALVMTGSGLGADCQEGEFGSGFEAERRDERQKSSLFFWGEPVSHLYNESLIPVSSSVSESWVRELDLSFTRAESFAVDWDIRLRQLGESIPERGRGDNYFDVNHQGESELSLSISWGPTQIWDYVCFTLRKPRESLFERGRWEDLAMAAPTLELHGCITVVCGSMDAAFSSVRVQVELQKKLSRASQVD